MKGFINRESVILEDIYFAVLIVLESAGMNSSTQSRASELPSRSIFHGLATRTSLDDPSRCGFAFGSPYMHESCLS